MEYLNGCIIVYSASLIAALLCSFRQATKVITISRSGEIERERKRFDRATSTVSIRRSVADTALNFRKLIKLAHVRYVRQTNQGDVETSSPIPACSCPTFSFLVVEREERYSGRASAKTIALISAGHNTWLAGVSWPIKRRPPVFQCPGKMCSSAPR